uniref:Bacterial repeat domain-containing protein n=1 Tax=viral metagenome TaxID=1070528 RepID=A0A6C0KWE5_9ZZZZ
MSRSSNGQFWYSGSLKYPGYPGFLNKKNGGAGVRRSTKFTAGNNMDNCYCGIPVELNNYYKPGGGGVGGSSISNRRAKNRMATVCQTNTTCFSCYNTLGQYSKSSNSNGFIPCIDVNVQPVKTGTYKVTYLGNGNTSGNVPIYTSSFYNIGTKITVLGNTGSLAKIGYTFGGWNTSADGTGTTYLPGTTYSGSDNLRLYAYWV